MYKRLITFCIGLFTMVLTALGQDVVKVVANSEDISDGLDLRVVAQLFGECRNLEEFEQQLNNPDSMFCNLDINGDGDVDYIRVVEVGESNQRLIVLQAVLAKDIYQDVASIYVEKNTQTQEVTVQIIGDEYVYGTNYIIEPVYIYRPVIYSWLWSPIWRPWYSPYYWGYYPHWWHYHHCWLHDRYWHHCHMFHRHHHHCSFQHGHQPHHGYHNMHSGVSRREYANTHRDGSFSHRHSGATNARDLRRTGGDATYRKSSTPINQISHRGEGIRGSGNVQTQQRSTQSTQRTTTTVQQRGGSSQTTQRSSTSSTQTRSTTQQSSRSGSTQQTSQRSSTTYQPRQQSSTPVRTSSSVSSQRSSGSYSSSQRSGGGGSGSYQRSSGSSYGGSRSGGSVSSPSRSSGGSSRGGSGGGSHRR